MKGKTKTQKGITLIALIITIVVLLILAVVSINSIQNEGILEYAENAVAQFGQAQQNESDLLAGYENYINNIGGTSEDSEEPEVTEINFKIVSRDGSYTWDLKAKTGMTWEQWAADTTYNTVGATFTSYEPYVWIRWETDGYECIVEISTDDYNNGKNIIESGAEYTLNPMEEIMDT